MLRSADRMAAPASGPCSDLSISVTTRRIPADPVGRPGVLRAADTLVPAVDHPYALVAQWTEQRPSNPLVAGSNPAGGTKPEATASGHHHCHDPPHVHPTRGEAGRIQPSGDQVAEHVRMQASPSRSGHGLAERPGPSSTRVQSNAVPQRRVPSPATGVDKAGTADRDGMATDDRLCLCLVLHDAGDGKEIPLQKGVRLGEVADSCWAVTHIRCCLDDRLEDRLAGLLAETLISHGSRRYRPAPADALTTTVPRDITAVVATPRVTTVSNAAGASSWRDGEAM